MRPRHTAARTSPPPWPVPPSLLAEWAHRSFLRECRTQAPQRSAGLHHPRRSGRGRAACGGARRVEFICMRSPALIRSCAADSHCDLGCSGVAVVAAWELKLWHQLQPRSSTAPAPPRPRQRSPATTSDGISGSDENSTCWPWPSSRRPCSAGRLAHTHVSGEFTMPEPASSLTPAPSPPTQAQWQATPRQPMWARHPARPRCNRSSAKIASPALHQIGEECGGGCGESWLMINVMYPGGTQFTNDHACPPHSPPSIPTA